MAALEDLLSEAQSLLNTSQPDAALEIFASNYPQYENNVVFLQAYGECLLENNDMELAYEILLKSCDMDPEAKEGSDKFFNLGQIIGGDDGLKLLDIGLNRLHQQLISVQNDDFQHDKALQRVSKSYKSKDEFAKHIIKKLNQGLFSKIEIWMTDLCMEPAAESQCDELINASLQLDPTSPDAYSLLSSIRISQQKNEEAKEALLKSWELFQKKKAFLEESVEKLKENDVSENTIDSALEYGELIQSFLALAKLSIELENYELTNIISSHIQEINENILETYYYGAFANILQAKQIIAPSVKGVEDYRDIDVKVLIGAKDETISSLLEDARITLTQGFKVINSELVDADPELVEQVNALLNELGGPLMSELMPQKVNAGEEDLLDEEIED